MCILKSSVSCGARPRALGGLLMLAAIVLTMGVTLPARADDIPPDAGWPRQHEKDGKTLIVYQPQVDSWNDYTSIHFRCAIAVEGVLKDERFGVAEIQADTVVDHSNRTVVVMPTSRDLRFANVSDADRAQLKAAVDAIQPSGNAVVISLDRVLACVDASKQKLQPKVALNLEPPRIHYSDEPAILVMFMGRPNFKPIAPGKPTLQFATNTNWDVLFDSTANQYYLLDGDGWIFSSDPLYGTWTPTNQLPVTADSLPADDNWAEVKKNIPGKMPGSAPKVFVSTEPCELIVTEGKPELRPIPPTQLSRVTNTESVLFQYAGNSNYYVLSAGRWFNAASLSGPWSAASQNLPADFAAIPDSDQSSFVKSSVPGTRQAQDAVLLASVPNTTIVRVADEKPVVVSYSGAPKFVPIQGTQVQYAVNTPYSVFEINNAYYCCEQGVWFGAVAATGPWTVCTLVPPAIYTIPPSSPHYNVTYVTIQSSTPTSVTYTQTAGYSGEYVASTGVLMFGAGMLVGAAIANDNHYYPPYPCYYSYGCSASYHYGYGGYCGYSQACYGPYGGAGYAAAYNPATGTYARGAAAYGPYGSAAAASAYNPYTGGYAARAQVNTAYGSAGRSAAYNPATNTYARGGYSSGQYGTAGAVETSRGTGAAAWNTQNSQGAVAKTRSGDVYATNGDSVYKHDQGGGWSTNSGSGWQSAPKPQASSESRENFESQAQSREHGNYSSEQANQFRSSGGFQSSHSSWSGGSRSRSYGGGGRRR